MSPLFEQRLLDGMISVLQEKSKNSPLKLLRNTLRLVSFDYFEQELKNINFHLCTGPLNLMETERGVGALTQITHCSFGTASSTHPGLPPTAFGAATGDASPSKFQHLMNYVLECFFFHKQIKSKYLSYIFM